MKNIIKDIIDDEEISNWHIIALLITIDILLMFIVNNYLLTREAYGVLYNGVLDLPDIDNYYIIARKFTIWSYIFSPLLIVLRVTIVSLLIQLFFMLRLVDISFKKLFRVILIGYGIMVLASAIQLFIIFLTPLQELSGELLTTTPFSVHHLFPNIYMNEVITDLLNHINIFEIFWIFLVATGLKMISGMKSDYASMVTFSVWIIIFLFKAGVNLYLYNIFES